MPTNITPLDPRSPKGREVAEALSQVLAQIRVEIAERQTTDPAPARDDAAEAA